jgi:hypothetical protein
MINDSVIRPRAFYPDYAGNAPPARTPGWNVGLERQLTDARALSRVLLFLGIGLGVLVLSRALSHRDAEDFS